MSPRPQRSRVSGHYAGPLSRLLAYVIDAALVFFLYGVIIGGSVATINLFLRSDIELGGRSGWMWLAGLAVWSFLYVFVGLVTTGRTPGKALVGLRVVSRDGSVLGSRQALIRTVALPFSFLLFGLGFLGIFTGRERRTLHDVAAGSAVVYDWGDRPAELPTPLSNWIERRQGELARSGRSDANLGGERVTPADS